MPEAGRITATVDVLRTDGGVKIRAVVWSGPDFSTATLCRGAIFDDEEAAHAAASEFVSACEVLGIPVEGSFVVPGGHEPAAAVLPEKRAESEYDRR